MLEDLKENLVHLYLKLPKNDLVRWTGGNVSETPVVERRAVEVMF